jgi:glycosyltransferase involved in cell wall biosynthesis
MINDCAYVGETILKFLSKYVEKVNIKRSRSFWDKTFRIGYKIFGSKGDIYHVNYLLQDCFIALIFGKRPLIGHAHGSDLSVALKHVLWKIIIRYNLKHCEKIIVSTPDILELARQYRGEASYIPNLVDTQLFYTKPIAKQNGKLKVPIASNSDWKSKSTDKAIKALSMIKNEVDLLIIRYGKDFSKTVELTKSLGLSLNILEKISHENMSKYSWNLHAVIESFNLSSFSMVSLNTIACDRLIITFVSSDYQEFKDFHLRDINTKENIANAILNADTKLWSKQYVYLEKNPQPEVVVKNG